MSGKQAHFIIPGEPKGKGRPRFSTGMTKGGKPFTTVRSPDDTIVYENLVRLEYERQCHGIYFEKDIPVAVEVRAFYQIPKSVSKKRTKTMLSGETRPLKRPDTDNVLKSILDAMNGFAFYDDSQVTDISASKYYSDAPRVEVTVKEVVYE